jgi:hypothetical protein
MPDRSRMQVVAETPFVADYLDTALSVSERDAVIVGIAQDPEGGDLIPGAGGLRKRRIPLPGRGKRGGARLITLYLGEAFPVYVVFAFSKNEREDLSPEQKRVLMRIVDDLKAQARRTWR